MHRLAIYPGTFDPPTLGHLDVIERAAKLFEDVIIAVGVNSSKSPLLSVEDRLGALTQSVHHLSNVKVESFSGLLVEYAKGKGARSIVRGLRATSDFEYEFQMALMNRHQNPDIETVFLMPDEKYVYLSSSIVREIARLQGDLRAFLPDPVSRAVRAKFAR